MVGQTISHYKILEKIGEGGMGVVYKAQDLKLDRLVALKFLPSHLSTSEQDKERFIQEAKSAATLNHPNICTIHAIEEHDGQSFIAMEFVEGQTLRDKKQSSSVKQAVDIGIQLADGIAAAHEKGVIHRDIKPENIMIRKDGIVQIMDFGLAKLRGASRLTKEGTTVGTAGYMSPEQIQGHDTDHRTDIFSLGVILYELLSGQSPFKGVHETAIIYEVVNVDPAPLALIKPDIDPQLDAIVLECLAKDPDERYQSAKEIAKELRRFKRESSRERVSRITATRDTYHPSQVMAAAPMDRREGSIASNVARLLAILTSNPWRALSPVLMLGIVVLGYLYVQSISRPIVVTRTSILPPENVAFDDSFGGHMVISPNGQYLAFASKDSTGRSQLWVRSLNSLSALPLPGTEGVTYPFWSHDSRSVGFFAGGKLKRVDAAGGPVTTICDAQDGRGGTWNQEGTILFAPGSGSGIHKVASAGGLSTVITTLDTVNKENSHRWPSFLPDGKHFVFTAQESGGSDGALWVSSLGDSTRRKIINVASNAEFVGGYLSYIRQSNLIVHAFNPSTMELTGDPVPIAERIVFGEARSRGVFSFSQNGVLVYQSGSTRPSELLLIDRAGKVISKLNIKAPTFLCTFSPDEKFLVEDAYDIVARSYDIWLYEFARNVSSRFTFDPANDIVPVFSFDGKTIMFSSNRKGSADIFRKEFRGMKSEEYLYGSPVDEYVTSSSPDGKYVLLSVNNPKTKWDLSLLPLTGEMKPIELAKSEFNEWLGIFSPDGRWIAYQSDESGKYEIYVRTVDPRGGKWQISTSGGENPHWTRKSNEIVYVSGDRKVMSSSVKYSNSSFEVVRTTALFELNIKGVGSFKDVNSNGQHFLVSVAGMEGSSPPATLVMNWQEELRKKP